MRFSFWLDRLRRISRSRFQDRRKAREHCPVIAEMLEQRELLTNLAPVDDAYQTAFGQSLVTRAGAAAATPDVTDVQTVDYSGNIQQLEYSDAFGLLFLRDSGGHVTVVDTVSKLVVDQHTPTYVFTDMDLTPDGRFLFVADYGGESTGYSRPSAPHFVHRYDLASRTWEVHQAPWTVWKIEAVSEDRYLAQEGDQWVEITLNTFGAAGGPSVELSRIGANYSGDMEFDHRTGRVFHDNSGNSSHELNVATVVGDRLQAAEATGVYGSASGYGGTTVLSADGSRFYSGKLQVDGANVRTNLQTFADNIYAATGQIAFGRSSYYNAANAAYLGTLGFQSTVFCTTDNGAHVWAYDATASRLHHYLIATQPTGVLANDNPSSGVVVELVSGPAQGQLTLQTNGSFSYSPNAAFAGTDTFQYRLASGTERSAAATVTITIPQPVAHPATAVNDDYSVTAGSTLSTTAGDSVFDVLQSRQSFAVGSGVLQLEFAAGSQLLFARTQQAIRVYDAATGNLIGTQTATNQFTDMDLTADGQYLFAADYGGEQTGYGTAITPHYVHRFDVANRQWVTHPSTIVKRIEAVSAERYLAQGVDQWVNITLNDFARTSIVSQVDGDYSGDIEFDSRTGRVYKGNSGISSPEIHVRTVHGDELVWTDSTGTYGTAGGNGGSSVLSTDGRYFFYGRLEVEAADVKHNLRTFPEIIRAATGLVAFGQSSYYAANSGLYLGQMPFGTDVKVASDDGQHLWALNGTQVQHFEIRSKPASLFGNDVGIGTATHQAVIVTPPAHGTVTLGSSGQFDYIAAVGFTGDDQFTYRGSGVLGDSSVGTATIHVRPSLYVAHDDTLSSIAGQTMSVSKANGLMANDTLPFVGIGSVELVSPPQHGVLTLNADGSLSYTPEFRFTGADSFQYRLVDAPDASAPAQVTINVLAAVNSPATLQNNQLDITLTAGSTVKLQEVAGVQQLTIDRSGYHFGAACSERIWQP